MIGHITSQKVAEVPASLSWVKELNSPAVTPPGPAKPGRRAGIHVVTGGSRLLRAETKN